MLIDQSYFIGQLEIAQLGVKEVRDKLKDITNRWEPVIMEAALGYDFYQAFLDGLDPGSDEVPEQRWLDLLNGVAFTTTYQKRRKWVGFAGGDNTQTIISNQRDDLFIYAGITPGFPVGGYEFTNTSLAPWDFTLEVFGEGTWEPIAEWNYKAGGGITLVNTAYRTTPGERWVIHFTKKKIQTISSGNKNLVSPLAGFIYFEYMAALAKQNTGIGIVKSEGENSTPASPAMEMCNAYNDACQQIKILWEFLREDQYKEISIYPEWDYRQVESFNYCFSNWWGYGSEDVLYSFKPVNPFGI